MIRFSELLKVFTVRVCVIVLCICFDVILPDHIPTGVETISIPYSSVLSKFVLRPFTRWDSVYYIQIASEGYTNEQQLAFFPLYSSILRSLADKFSFGSLHERVIISGLLLNIVSFLCSYIALKGILRKLNFKEDFKK